MDLHDIVMPINIEVYHRYLQQAAFDASKTQFLINGFRHGFDIGYRGPLNRQDIAENRLIRIGTEQDMWNKLMREVELGRHAGPFTSIPFNSYVQLPIGLVPKSGNKTRLIFHLSFDFGEDSKNINYHTPKEWCMVKYHDLGYAIKTCLHLTGELTTAIDADGNLDCREEDEDSLPDLLPRDEQQSRDVINDITQRVFQKIFMAKNNLMSAFRILPIMPKQGKFLIMKCRCPGTQKVMCFVDKNLPFESSISCARFQLFSDSLKCLVEFATGRFFHMYKLP